jgi:DNA-directed RNA polymerase specialized sigma24 family protein
VTTPDDTNAQPTADSEVDGYDRAVSDTLSPAARAAVAAIKHMRAAEAAATKARDDRDAAIARMCNEEGLRVPDIARILGMSTSNVRLVTRYNRR